VGSTSLGDGWSEPLWGELEQLQFIEIDGRKIDVTFYLGGDLEFHRVMIGLQPGSKTYFCPWCTHGHHPDPPRPRTVNADKATGQKESAILASIPPNHRLPCMLHLRMAIGRILGVQLIRIAQKIATNCEYRDAALDVWSQRGTEMKIEAKWSKGLGKKGKISLNGKSARNLIERWPSLIHVFNKFDCAVPEIFTQSVPIAWRHSNSIFMPAISSNAIRRSTSTFGNCLRP
jgi:hypothetical protein